MILGPKAKNLTVIGRFASNSFTTLQLRQQLCFHITRDQNVVPARMGWNNKFFRRQNTEVIVSPSRKKHAQLGPNIVVNGEFVSVCVFVSKQVHLISPSRKKHAQLGPNIVVNGEFVSVCVFVSKQVHLKYGSNRIAKLEKTCTTWTKYSSKW